MNTKSPSSAGLAARVLVVTLAICFLGTARYALAQDFDAYRPEIPRSSAGKAELPDVPKPADGSTKVLVDQLKGIIFVDHPDKAIAGRVDVEGIRFGTGSRLPLLRSNSFRRVVAPYLNGPISIYRLNELARDVILFYRRNNRPVVDVSIPQQDITDGVLQVVVVESRVGRVIAKGACYFDPCLLTSQARTRPGGRLYESVLLEDLEWLNRNPFREIDLELTPGSNFGQTDVVFNVHDRLPWRGYIGYEDTGTLETDYDRMLFGVNWGNALWRDHQAGYQYTTSGDFSKLKAHSGMYSIPLNNRDTLLIYGCYAQVSSDAIQNFGNTGMAWQASFRYNKRLRAWDEYEHRLVAGFDFKETNTNLEFGGSQVFDSDADIAQIAVGYHGEQFDCRGSTLLGIDMYVSPGEFSSDDNDIAYQEIRALARANYIYSRAYFERLINLPYRLSFMGRVVGQLADANLLPSEQLGFGGYDTVRGYDMRRVNGDRGYVVNFELRTDPVSLGLGHCNDDELQLLGFYDFGGAGNHTLLPNEPWLIRLAGAGFGLRYTMAPTVSMRLDYGWQLESLPGQTRGSRIHLGVLVAR